VNVCEMKFSEGEYCIQKSEDVKIRNRMEEYRNETNTKKSIIPVLITTFGLQRNAYSNNIKNVVVMDDLF